MADPQPSSTKIRAQLDPPPRVEPGVPSDDSFWRGLGVTSLAIVVVAAVVAVPLHHMAGQGPSFVVGSGCSAVAWLAAMMLGFGNRGSRFGLGAVVAVLVLLAVCVALFFFNLDVGGMLT